jgi:CRP-like cAMP-binding protein
MAQNFFSYGDVNAEVTTQTGPAPSAPILAGLSDEDWSKLISFAARRRYAADAIIIKAPDSDRAIYFIVSGSVRVVAPQLGNMDSDLMVLVEQNVFGLQSFLDGQPRTANAIANGPVELLMLNLDMFEQLAAWQPRIAIALMRDIGANMASRLRHFEPSL